MQHSAMPSACAHALSHRILILMMLAVLLSACSVTTRQIIGATEHVTIEEAGMAFTARIDTGAASCSLHATDIKRIAGPDRKQDRVSFMTATANGDSRRIETGIVDVVRINSAEGSSLRYKVALTVNHSGRSKQVLFTLRDRSHMEYRLLLGRNWLSGDYIVDVAPSRHK
ncbi:hypothetical protein FEF65_11265 [Mariprofundus erugo]|uniref:Retropepsin-like aspartic endopeptidase domain-containing protein n=2 Tax=Mariprofundus erugo TaxID=2528639 RepID=A0A5R9GSE6_9PROT|nr:hypothetical protein FEF65_11265 [Mariprofundus erugo]